jgi:16S rRNA (adenine1518-N6/adenine1519-N6)-dimethyltransferase
MMVRPKKHLGQHFLTDQNIAAKIVEQLSDEPKAVVEVGAGTGILTRLLIPRFGTKFHVVEIDHESIDYLKIHYPDLGENLIAGDFLKTDLQQFTPDKLAVIGNFPYNISSQIFFHILEHPETVSEVVCMIQKEVAERLASPPGNKTYGILSVLLQAYYDIRYCFTVNEHVFNPPPRVKSAVIKLQRNQTQSLGCDEVLFRKIVKAGFNQRRKTLRNALKEYTTAEITENEVFNKRAEQLSVQDFVMLTLTIEKARKHANP